jgi:hypothetical protein
MAESETLASGLIALGASASARLNSRWAQRVEPNTAAMSCPLAVLSAKPKPGIESGVGTSEDGGMLEALATGATSAAQTRTTIEHSSAPGILMGRS